MKHYVLYLAIMWAVHFINVSLGYALNIFGVNLNWISWVTQFTKDPTIALILSPLLVFSGFLTHPFLHGSNSHIISNSLAYIPLGVLVASSEDFKKLFWKLAIGTGGLSSLFVMLGSRNGFIPVMVGASGVIYGFMGYLLASAIHKFNFLNVLFAVACWVISGDAIGGMLPWAVPEQVSWEGHLAGFISGVVLAFCNFQNVRSTPAQQPQQSMFSSGFPFNS